MSEQKKINTALALGTIVGIGLALFAGNTSKSKGLAGAKSASKVKVLDYS